MSETNEQFLAKQCFELQATVARLRGALEWYGDDTRYPIRGLSDVGADKGERARTALKEAT